MARMYLKDYIDVGSGGPITAIHYQVAKDPEFKLLIDEKMKKDGDLREWVTPLPKRPEDGEGFYKDLPEVFGRLMIFSGPNQEYSSEWFECPVESQLSYPIKITDGDEVIETTTDALGWVKK